jgi:hypothetical protein
MKAARPVENDRPKTDADIFHEKRSIARKAIAEIHTCPIHSLPNKDAYCWRAPEQGLCYPLTESNLNLWATLHVRILVFCLFLDTHPISRSRIPRSI